MDGDGRGGAALSMRAVTGKPIKLIVPAEKMDALEECFNPKRIADRNPRHGRHRFAGREGRRTIDAERRRWPGRCSRESST